MSIQRMCKDCGRSIIVYSTVQTRCPKCQIARQKPKVYKPIKQVGKETERYNAWRDTIARPYLEQRFGRACSFCKLPAPVNEETGIEGWHQVDHINKRGSHIKQKFDVHNVRFLCDKCHKEIT